MNSKIFIFLIFFKKRYHYKNNVCKNTMNKSFEVNFHLEQKLSAWKTQYSQSACIIFIL